MTDRCLDRLREENSLIWPMMVSAAPSSWRQGNRVKGSAGIDKACEEIVVPGGDLAPNAQRVFAGRFADQVVSHMLDGCEVGGGVLGADAAFVIAEHHVHDPVHAFDCPVGAQCQ